MPSRKLLDNFMKDIEIYVAVSLIERVTTIISLIFDEERDLDIIRCNLLGELAKYVAPYNLESVSISVRKFIIAVREQAEELEELNNSEEDSEEEDSEEEPSSPKQLINPLSIEYNL
jgi:hypothetical protein